MSIEQRTMRKVTWRLIPFLFLLFIVNYLDRVNVGFAALKMNADLGFSAASYGFGAGVFFVGYFLFEVPSNLILERVGARFWITRITVTWGIVSTAMALVDGPTTFYVLRFLLGVAEAGFLPGIILYLTYWFPSEYRGRAIAMFMTSTAIAIVIGAPISGALLSLDGVWGLRGWQWMFILEGSPSIVLGIATFFYLADKPEEARWLAPDEKAWIESKLDAELGRNQKHASFLAAVCDIRVLSITAICFCLLTSVWGVLLWLPQVIRGLGNLTAFQVGILTAIPYVFAALVMVIWARRSDRMQERKWHYIVAALVGVIGLLASAHAPSSAWAFIAICVTATGIWSTFGVFWTIPTNFLSGTAAAGGIAFVNSFGNLGGFTGPFLVGWVRDSTQSFSTSLTVLAGVLFLSCIIAATLRVSEATDGRSAAPAKQASQTP